MNRNRLLIGATAALVLIWLGGVLALHFGQKRHNELGYNLALEFPASRPIVPGEVFASTLSAIVDHELRTGFGWRPNDFLLWGPKVGADNNSNRQLGIIQAVRETSRVFKDHLTKVSSNQYDLHLVTADTDFRNDAEKWILPAPEAKYEDGVKNLREYVKGLHDSPPSSRELNIRAVELIRLIQTWGDLLGDAHANLYRTTQDDGRAVHAWETDNYFYHAQGYAHVIYHMMQAVAREYATVLADDPVLKTLFDETEDALGKAAVMKPVIVLDGSPTSLFANHRHNLDSYINEARQKMYSIREELQRSPL